MVACINSTPAGAEYDAPCKPPHDCDERSGSVVKCLTPGFEPQQRHCGEALCCVLEQDTLLV